MALRLATLAGGSYKKKSSTEALLSQVLRGMRPVPEQLISDILTLLTIQYTEGRRAVFNSGPSIADVKLSAEHHNSEVRKGIVPNHSPSALFLEAASESRSQVIFACENILHSQNDFSSLWTELMFRQLHLLFDEEVDPVKIEYLATKKITAYSIWDLIFSYARSLTQTSSKNGWANGRSEDVARKISQLNSTGKLMVSILDIGSTPPCIVSQAAFLSKKTPNVYTIISNTAIQLNDREAYEWNVNFDSLCRGFSSHIHNVTWEDYAVIHRA